MNFDVSNLDIPLLPFGSGLVSVILLGLLVKPVMGYWTDAHAPKQKPFSPPVATAGAAIGLLERILFFASIVVGYPVFIGAWLVFKVAAKWEAWGPLIRLPELRGPKDICSDDSSDPKDSHLGDFRERWQLSTWLNSKFLLGTLLNIAIAGIGAWVFVQVLKIITVP